MFSDIKSRIAGQVLADAKAPWADAAAAWQRVLAAGSVPEADARALWAVVQLLQGALRGMEKGLREARAAAVDPRVRQALSATAYALADTQQLLEGPAYRYLEGKLGPVPPDTPRWRLVAADRDVPGNP